MIRSSFYCFCLYLLGSFKSILNNYVTCPCRMTIALRFFELDTICSYTAQQRKVPSATQRIYKLGSECMEFVHTGHSTINSRNLYQAFDKYVSLWVSEWLLFKANSAIFQLCHDENKLIFKDFRYDGSRVRTCLTGSQNTIY